MMYYVTYVCTVCIFFRFFTSAESAKHGKDALAKKLEEDLRTTTGDEAEASDISEPPEKASRAELEAAVAPRRSKSSSSFMKEFDRIREEREEPGGAASCSSTAVQMHGGNNPCHTRPIQILGSQPPALSWPCCRCLELPLCTLH